MISKNKQSHRAGFRILLAIPTAFVLLLMFSFTSLEKTTSLLQSDLLEPTMQVVQSSLDNLQNPQQKPVVKSPVKTTINSTSPVVANNDNNKKRASEIATNYKRGFPGGNIEMYKFLKSNYKFPPEVIKNGKQSIISVSFIASANGEIKDAKVYKSLDPVSDKEVLRVINMMPKWTPYLKNGKPVSRLVYLTIFLTPDPANGNLPPVATFGLTMGSEPNPSASNDDIPLKMVEQNPEFKGGYEGLLSFLKEKLKYPEEAKKAGVQGTVFVSFVVEKTGKVSDINLVRGIGSGCDEEAIRVTMAMPDWTPGRNGGKIVPVVFQLPIKFKLEAK